MCLSSLSSINFLWVKEPLEIGKNYGHPPERAHAYLQLLVGDRVPDSTLRTPLLTTPTPTVQEPSYEGLETLEEPEYNRVFFTPQDHCTHGLIAAVVACTRLVHDQASQYSSTKGEGVFKPLPLTESY